MRDCGGRRGEPRFDPFREERRDDAREHVAGAGRRERRRAVRRDEHAFARRRNDRVGAFQQHDRAEPGRRAPCRVEPVRVDLAGVDVEQPCELAAVRREDRRRGARERLELPQRIRIEHDGNLEPLEQDPHELDRPVGAAEAGTDRDGVRLLGSFEHQVGGTREQPAARVLRQRPLHDLEQRRLEHRQRRLRRGNGDIARVRAERSERGEDRRARQPA